MKLLRVRLDDPLWERLAAAASASGVTPSTITRNALNEHLKEEPHGADARLPHRPPP